MQRRRRRVFWGDRNQTTRAWVNLGGAEKEPIVGAVVGPQRQRHSCRVKGGLRGVTNKPNPGKLNVLLLSASRADVAVINLRAQE